MLGATAMSSSRHWLRPILSQVIACRPGVGDCAAVEIHGIRRGEDVHRSATTVGDIDVEYDFIGSTKIGTKAHDRRKVVREERPGQQETEPEPAMAVS